MTKPTWAGRIPGGLAPEAWNFLHSLPHDRFLWDDDITATMAHVQSIASAGVIPVGQARKMLAQLARMVGRPELIDDHDEDVHSAIERVLTEALGDVGARVHAGRSRNDQVATALRLWARRNVLDVWESATTLVTSLVTGAREHINTPAPGYTHLQRAQPITLAHWMLAHAAALSRDLDRFSTAYESANVCPLGAGALAGNTLGINPVVAADLLNFGRTFTNSIDAVSDRDFLLDASYACAVATLHTSRLAEEFVWWSSSEFGFIQLPDRWATGSSMMPQKRNPDVAEFARGVTGPATGALMGLLMTVKSLPLAYDRDLQADKQTIAGVLPTVASALSAMAGLITDTTFEVKRLREAVSDDALLATDLAEALVLVGVPFRQAHETVAAISRRAEGGGLSAVIEADPNAAAPLSATQALEILSIDSSLKRRTTPGGPSARSVRKQIRQITKIAAAHRETIQHHREGLPDPRKLKKF